MGLNGIGAAAFMLFAFVATLTFTGKAQAQTTASVNNAYTFLYNMMDKYASGTTLRLPPSYVSTSVFNTGNVNYIYDSDVMIIALLKRGTVSDISRAEILGNALIYAQNNDPLADGRVRNAYYTDPFIASSGAVNIADAGSYTGNMAWTGIALVQLYYHTQNLNYLYAAVALGNFIQRNFYSTTGSGGYTAGFNASGTAYTNKSTEHQIDLYGFFTMMSETAGGTLWPAYAQHALTELEATWNSSGGYFWIGTLSDGVTIDKTDDPTPEDIQSWSYLATKLTAYEKAVSWVVTNLSVTKGNFSGVAFDTGDYGTGVWFEGTAHTAAALKARNLSGDAAQATKYLNDIQYAQTNGLNENGLGIIAASINGLEADGPDGYYAALHVGATAWYGIAAEGGNPFAL